MKVHVVALLFVLGTSPQGLPAQESRPTRKLSEEETTLIAVFEAETKGGKTPSEDLQKAMRRVLFGADLGARSTGLELFSRCDPGIAVPALEEALIGVVKDIDQRIIQSIYVRKKPKPSAVSKKKSGPELTGDWIFGGAKHAREVIEKIGGLRHPLAEEALCRFLKKHKPSETSVFILQGVSSALAGYGTHKSLEAVIRAYKGIESFALKPARSKPKLLVTKYNSLNNMMGVLYRLAGPKDTEKIHAELAAAFGALGAEGIPDWKAGKRIARAWAGLLRKYKGRLPPDLAAK